MKPALPGTPRSDYKSQLPVSVDTPRLRTSLQAGAEAMLTGSPARAAYKRAMTTAVNPPQSRIELMAPAGNSWAVSASPRPVPERIIFQTARVSEIGAMLQEAGAQKLSQSSLFGSRFANKVPKPLPADPAKVMHKMSVTITGAKGLRNTDNPGLHRGEGLSDPYCTCEIIGKPHSIIETGVVADTLDPVWNHTGDVLDYVEGDSLCFHIWDFDQGQKNGDLLGKAFLKSSQFFPEGFEGELPLREAGDGIRAFLRISIPDMREREAQLNMYGGILPEDVLTAKHVRKFMLCARRLGARGLPRLAQALQAEAGADNALAEKSFEKVAMAEGLCTFLDGCKRIFQHFKMVGGGAVRVEMLMKCARGVMPGKRLEAVREVWQGLDPQGLGYVDVAHLMAAFDPRCLPAVRYDGLTMDLARREYLEGLGVCRFTVDCKNDAFALEEASAGRRPLPIGAPAPDMRVPRHARVQGAGAATLAPAGKEGPSSEVPRRRSDFIDEVNARPSRVQMDSRILPVQFESFYTALSHGITDDRLFERTLRDPWKSLHLHENSMAARWDMSPGRRRGPPKAPKFRMSAIFEDGSHRVVLLSNIDGISDAIGHAGVHCSQMWSWGPGVKAEIIRRLEEEGVCGVVQVKPIPC